MTRAPRGIRWAGGTRAAAIGLEPSTPRFPGETVRATGCRGCPLLAEAGGVVICGGRGGVMEAASRGASGAGGIAIGVLPGSDPEEANEHVAHVVATGVGQARNLAVTLVVGALWGRLTWGVFWRWDARLTTTAFLFVTYIGYLAVRRLGDTREARQAVAHEALQAGEVGDDRHLHLAHAEPRVGAGDPDVSRGDQVNGSAEAPAGDCRHHRLAAGRDRGHGSLEPVDLLEESGTRTGLAWTEHVRPAGHHRGQVQTVREVGTVPGEHNRANLVIGVQAGENLGQFVP